MLKFLIISTFYISLAMAGTTSPSTWTGLNTDRLQECVVREEYRYTMKGSVRLLIFWVGKDGVGGGSITRFRSSTPDVADRVDAFEVLFGSDPDEVPGRRNRWGYARELSRWEDGTLSQTLFEGFMSKSDEESLSEVRDAEEDSAGALYEIARSTVRRKAAEKEIWRFFADPEISYKEPDPVALEFEQLLFTEPVEETVLPNEDLYASPWGFLSAVDFKMQEALREQIQAGNLKSLEDRRLRYVYNARLYDLWIRGGKLHSRVKLDDERTFENVLQIKFRLYRLDTEEDHDFEIWMPVSGDYAGIPLKVVDRPRWWLKVELILEEKVLSPDLDSEACPDVTPSESYLRAR